MRTMPLAEVAAHLDDLLDPEAEEDREGNGLALDAGREVRRIGAALNTSFQAINAATEAGVELLLVHHAPWSQIDLHLRETKLDLLRARGISLYAAHECLDRATGFGVADTLARLVGVEVEGRIADGFGVMGTAEDASFDAWMQRVADALGERARAWPNADRFGRVGVVPGAGGLTTWIEEARAAGCDTFLTGEGSLFTELYARETGINLVLASHHATELPGICALAERAAAELGLRWVPLPEAEGVSGNGRAPADIAPRPR